MATTFAGLQSLDPSNFIGDRLNVGETRMAGDTANTFRELSGLEEDYNLQTAIKDIELAKKKSRMADRFGASIQGFNNQAQTTEGFSKLLNIAGQLAGSGAFGGGGGGDTIGLGDGFNVGQGQAGLDPSVDLNNYLTSSPFSSIAV